MKWKLLWILLCSSPAYAFPEMIGHGYSSCKACHYDSSGGGPLTEYGHTIAEEILSVWSFQKEGDTFYGLVNTHPISLNGDFRTLFQHYEDDAIRLDQSFPMQREVSIGFDPSKNVSFIGSAGLYGPNATEYEYRRYYAKVTLGQGIGIRAGRFMPAFGILQPDHTKATRELFGEGKESLNLETSITHKYFELFLTRIAGSNSRITTSSKPVVVQRDDRNGYAAKLSLFLTKGVQIGGSYASLSDDASIPRDYLSYHAFVGNKKIWSFAEYQTWANGDSKLYATLGCAPVKGLWVKMEINRAASDDPEVFGTLQFFPRPHYELLISGSKKQYFLITHFYL